MCICKTYCAQYVFFHFRKDLQADEEELEVEDYTYTPQVYSTLNHYGCVNFHYRKDLQADEEELEVEDYTYTPQVYSTLNHYGCVNFHYRKDLQAETGRNIETTHISTNTIF